MQAANTHAADMLAIGDKLMDDMEAEGAVLHVVNTLEHMLHQLWHLYHFALRLGVSGALHNSCVIICERVFTQLLRADVCGSPWQHVLHSTCG
jgi:hypothetical protein